MGKQIWKGSLLEQAWVLGPDTPDSAIIEGRGPEHSRTRKISMCPFLRKPLEQGVSISLLFL